MNTAETTTETTEKSFLSEYLNAEELSTPSMDSTQPYALSLVEMANSVQSLNESKAQISSLVQELAKQATPKNQELIIRGIKEIRELLKMKLEYGKFAHVVGAEKKPKVQKETA